MNIRLDDYKSLEKKIIKLRNSLKSHPRGSLRKRQINGKEYYYLQYRENKHIKSDYVPLADVENVRIGIIERKKIEAEIRSLEKRLDRYSELLGIHRFYRPVKNVDYNEYTLFMSSLAHDHKNLGTEAFIEKYDVSKFRGLNKRYLSGFIDYITGVKSHTVRKTNDLVLDPYTYLMYFTYGDKEVLEEELKKAIPCFLCRGLLITKVQEAVDVTNNK